MAAEDYLPDGGLFPDDDIDDGWMGSDRYDYMKRRALNKSNKFAAIMGTPFVIYTNHTKETKMLDVKKMNKFYVASDRISEPVSQGRNDRWTRKTLAEATEHAQELLNKQPNKDIMLIVKIVRIVKRAKAPIQIQDIK